MKHISLTNVRANRPGKRGPSHTILCCSGTLHYSYMKRVVFFFSLKHSYYRIWEIISIGGHSLLTFISLIESLEKVILPALHHYLQWPVANCDAH